MKWVFTYLKPLRARIALGTCIKIIGTLAELMIPFLLSYILENVINSNDVTKILFFGAFMVLCALVACLGNIIANRMAEKTTMTFSTHMRRELFSKTLKEIGYKGTYNLEVSNGCYPHDPIAGINYIQLAYRIARKYADLAE